MKSKNKSAQNSSAGQQQVNVLGFARVSSSHQDNSIGIQQEKIRDYCKINNLNLIDIIVNEDVSRTTAFYKRPDAARILEYIKSSNIKGIIALKMDRLFGSALDAITVTRQWDSEGIALHLIDMGGQSLNTSTPMGKMMITMMAAMAELEVGMTQERIRTVIRHKKSNLIRYNNRVYGFRPVTDRSGVQRLVKEKSEMVVVEKIFELHNSGVNNCSIARMLNQENLKAGVKNRFYPAGVASILGNSIYDKI